MVIEGYDYDNEVFRRLRVDSEGQLIIAHIDHTPHYKELPHGTLTTVWTPDSGKHIHATGVVLSVGAAGVVTLYHGDTIFCTLHFNEKRAVPIPIIEDLTFGVDVVLKAKYVGDTGEPTGYITVIGHEH